jgi:hypothetical protein
MDILPWNLINRVRNRRAASLDMCRLTQAQLYSSYEPLGWLSELEIRYTRTFLSLYHNPVHVTSLFVFGLKVCSEKWMHVRTLYVVLQTFQWSRRIPSIYFLFTRSKCSLQDTRSHFGHHTNISAKYSRLFKDAMRRGVHRLKCYRKMIGNTCRIMYEYGLGDVHSVVLRPCCTTSAR